MERCDNGNGLKSGSTLRHHTNIPMIVYYKSTTATAPLPGALWCIISCISHRACTDLLLIASKIDIGKTAHLRHYISIQPLQTNNSPIADSGGKILQLLFIESTIYSLPSEFPLFNVYFTSSLLITFT